MIVTRITKGSRVPASTAYVSHLLDPCGVSSRALRCTRLAHLVCTLDPKLVAAALGMDAEGVMFTSPTTSTKSDPERRAVAAEAVAGVVAEGVGRDSADALGFLDDAARAGGEHPVVVGGAFLGPGDVGLDVLGRVRKVLEP
ncbi:hypothetical protein [Streptomyces sp. SP18CS02]|uniref:hypothetical protein n=1 Tax=Streptomyces sp. SP18CS02 TaxID=3002531 RepID=UPI002E75F4B3|nr:hypothetical protein [Streptomyces sp. SP18CS02]MEE1750987.1 hypothetical protein [Streptomyces sp. SP18CS02]